MYSERDFAEIRGRLQRRAIALTLVLAALLALYVLAMAMRWKWLAFLSGALIAVAACYGLLAQIAPCARYLAFLTDIRQGGSHTFVGTLTFTSGEEEPQDGARVYPVRMMLDEPREERTYYLNVSKALGFPAVGDHVRLRCFGRHILEAEIVE